MGPVSFVDTLYPAETFSWPGILIIFSIDLFFPSFHGTTAHYVDDADDGLVYATRISFFFCGFLGTGMVQKDGFG